MKLTNNKLTIRNIVLDWETDIFELYVEKKVKKVSGVGDIYDIVIELLEGRCIMVEIFHYSVRIKKNNWCMVEAL